MKKRKIIIIIFIILVTCISSTTVSNALTNEEIQRRSEEFDNIFGNNNNSYFTKENGFESDPEIIRKEINEIINSRDTTVVSNDDVNSKEYQEKMERAKKLRHSVGMYKPDELEKEGISSTITTNTNSDSNKTVYITKNSAKYHLGGCDYLDGTPHGVTLAYAKNNGYGACKYCKPYVNTTYIEEDDDIVMTICYVLFGILVIIVIVIIIINILERKKKVNINDYNLNNNKNLKIKYEEIKEKTRKENVKEENIKEEKKENIKTDLPMNWYDFWISIKLPILLIFFGISCLGTIRMDSRYLAENPDMLSNIPNCLIAIIITSTLLYFMYEKKKNTFIFITFYLIIEGMLLQVLITLIIDISAIDTIIMKSLLLSIFALWFIPNYIYFKKRKHLFIN